MIEKTYRQVFNGVDGGFAWICMDVYQIIFGYRVCLIVHPWYDRLMTVQHKQYGAFKSRQLTQKKSGQSSEASDNFCKLNQKKWVYNGYTG